MINKDKALTALIAQLEQWHDQGKHQTIADTLKTHTETHHSYLLASLLARALNNLGHYDEGLKILLEFKEQGKEDGIWHFRVGYSLFYLEGREVEAIPYFEQAIALGDNNPNTYELLLEARSYLEDTAANKAAEPAFTFTPKAYARLTLNMRLRPEHRVLLEEPLDYMLRANKWGCVSGGGTAVTKDGLPKDCNIDLDLVAYTEEIQYRILAMAQKLEVAKGATMAFYNADQNATETHLDISIKVGRLAGIGFSFAFKDLPENGENGVLNELYESINTLLLNNGALSFSYGVTDTHAELYFYGEGGYSFMYNKVAPFLTNNPLGQKCRVFELA